MPFSSPETKTAGSTLWLRANGGQAMAQAHNPARLARFCRKAPAVADGSPPPAYPSARDRIGHRQGPAVRSANARRRAVRHHAGKPRRRVRSSIKRKGDTRHGRSASRSQKRDRSRRLRLLLRQGRSQGRDDPGRPDRSGMDLGRRRHDRHQDQRTHRPRMPSELRTAGVREGRRHRPHRGRSGKPAQPRTPVPAVPGCKGDDLPRRPHPASPQTRPRGPWQGRMGAHHVGRSVRPRLPGDHEGDRPVRSRVHLGDAGHGPRHKRLRPHARAVSGDAELRHGIPLWTGMLRTAPVQHLAQSRGHVRLRLFAVLSRPLRRPPFRSARVRHGLGQQSRRGQFRRHVGPLDRGMHEARVEDHLHGSEVD